MDIKSEIEIKVEELDPEFDDFQHCSQIFPVNGAELALSDIKNEELDEKESVKSALKEFEFVSVLEEEQIKNEIKSEYLTLFEKSSRQHSKHNMASKKFNIIRDAEEILNILDNDEQPEIASTEIDAADLLEIVLNTPQDGGDSDRDDANSDTEEFTTNVRNIGKGVLSQKAEVRAIRKGLTIDIQVDEEISEPSTSQSKKQCITSSKSKKIIVRKWSSKSLKKSSKIYDCNAAKTKPAFLENIEKSQPIDLFKMCFTEEFMNHICRESVKYASQKGDQQFTLSVDELYVYFGILLLSGYNKLPFRRMYWERRPDSNNNLVNNSISRNKFEKIHQFLHFNDNMTIDPNDKVYKIRPLIDHLNNKFFNFVEPLGSKFSLGEAMEPYYGHHSMKQFIRGKPVTFGFKFWCLTTPEGYLVKFHPYTGGGDKIPGKTVGSSVIEKLCLGFVTEGSSIYMDNYFTSLSLMDTLTTNKLFCIGTIRSDRIENAPLQDLKKTCRGTYCAVEEKKSGITLVRWNDNSQVTMVTNSKERGIFEIGSCKRWSRRERKQAVIPQPNIVKLYNKNMEGVDLFDKRRALYRIGIRSKKWFWPYFRFCLNVSVVNLWMLYRNIESIPLLEFTRQIVISLLSAPDIPTQRGVKPSTKTQVLNAIRFDRKDHLIDRIDKRRRCAICGISVQFRCTKCNVGLHARECFVKYHIK
ncbi:UNVERIFIED_CONTAM: hypothetical protein RMT77_014413 [Armadillidium vulgare]